MKPALLIADDERGIVDTIKAYLSPQYEILTAYSGQEALHKAEKQPDLILLDINMSGMDGLTVCRTIRNHVPCPILFLTARIESADQIMGFRSGADDYIVKPFDLDELAARISAHLRRERRRTSTSNLRFFGGCAVDYSARTVTVHGEAVSFSRREFDILELLRTHQELWRQAEERKRLNAAFAHDLRNPITVLKGSVKLLRQNPADQQTLVRLETYTVRIEQYVEAMRSIQQLEQLSVRTEDVSWAVLRSELEETARLLAPTLDTEVRGPDMERVRLDHGIFLTVAENLIGNAARFARKKLEIILALEGNTLLLSVVDDGPGFPRALLQDGPKPFGKSEAHPEHWGMGLYNSGFLCRKHGGGLRLENRTEGGAAAIASLQIKCGT